MLKEISAPLINYTTLRIGGPARMLIEAETSDELIAAAKSAADAGLLWRVIGHGSNILASDRGISGAIIIFKNMEPPVISGDGLVRVSAGMPLSELVAALSSQGLSGLENLAGIPGTVGGAIAGNAGAYGSAIGDILKSAVVLARDGNVKTVAASELFFSYRASILKQTLETVIEAEFKTSPSDPALLKKTAESRLADRAQKHPDCKTVPTAGSWFKNPPGSGGKRIAAGRLLEETGCKQLRVGGAFVWPKHANIIVTDGSATSEHVRELANDMARRVEEGFGIKLEWEVAYLE